MSIDTNDLQQYFPDVENPNTIPDEYGLDPAVTSYLGLGLDDKRLLAAVHPRVVESSKNLTHYLMRIGIEKEDLKPPVLDLGAPMDDNVSKALNAEGILAFSVNPLLVQSWNRELTNRSSTQLEPTQKAIAALAQSLPYKDKSFGTVLMIDTFSYIPETRTDIEKTFSEIVRVLIPGGKAYISYAWLTSELYKMLSTLSSQLGFSIVFSNSQTKTSLENSKVNELLDGYVTIELKRNAEPPWTKALKKIMRNR